ncbi:hypothetical protein SAMN06269185_1121 [Natronoarchaeum philippinense]|uniref:Thioredoxin domain-containing protein n=1 Tax=Natronoarchaeum philippinense TaxID=558529 RepID=A0A285NF70_NATPI|nr:DUF255 domain-containing protein [Natronoarchaeum philippinense]SNZ06301.1 hypothetical protein SAMN06269185_1121 [Natronoarchaeum philippinense]
MDESAERTRVEWHEWGPEPFEIADRTGKPVLLSLSATWCSWCHEMDGETYSEPRIAANVNDGFVPVRVDVDRHPRVRERYNMGGFPSTVFLTPEGEQLTGAGYLGPDGMRQVITSVRKLWDGKGAEAGRVPRSLQGEATPAGELTPQIEEQLLGALHETYDERSGGWGTDAKFPMPRTIEFALKRERQQALRTLDAVGANLFDEHAGGFYRYAAGEDWSEPHYEKMLDTNAAIVRAFANAYLYTGGEEYRQPAADTIDYLTTTLWTGDAFAGSQSAGEGASYYARAATEREDADEPSVDPTLFADRNALAVDALLTYRAYTDDDAAGRFAERALDTLDAELIADGEVSHYRDPENTDDVGESLLLADHAHTVAALTTAREVLGADALDGRAIEVARRVADAAIDELHAEGSFRDGPASGEGLLDRPLRPLDGNVEMVDALLDLAVITGEDRYHDVARETIEAFAGAWDRFGPQVAVYGSAASRLLNGTLVIRVGNPAGSDLHRAALRMGDHEKVVVPGADDVADGTATVSIVTADDADATAADPATTPGELETRVSDLTADRSGE